MIIVHLICEVTDRRRISPQIPQVGKHLHGLRVSRGTIKAEGITTRYHSLRNRRPNENYTSDSVLVDEVLSSAYTDLFTSLARDSMLTRFISSTNSVYLFAVTNTCCHWEINLGCSTMSPWFCVQFDAHCHNLISVYKLLSPCMSIVDHIRVALLALKSSSYRHEDMYGRINIIVIKYN